MANPSKNKGTACETAVVRYLQGNGFENAERRALSGSADRGDILVCPGLIIECKHYADPISDAMIADWQRQTAVEKANANASEAVLVVRRNGKTDPAVWFAYRQHRNGFWHQQLLGDCVELLRLEGWGSPLSGAEFYE